MNRIDILKAVLVLSLLILPIAVSGSDDIPFTDAEVHAVAERVLSAEIIHYMQVHYTNANVKCQNTEKLRQAIELYPEYPREIKDSVGKTITIYAPFQRVVAYQYHAIAPLGIEDRVIGVAGSILADSEVEPWALGKVNIGGGGPYEPDMEKLLGCNPDCVLTYTRLGPGREFFEDRLPPEIPVIRIDVIRPLTLPQEIQKLGYIFDREEDAAAYLEWYNGYVDDIKNRISTIPENERIRVFVDVWSAGNTGSITERSTAGSIDHYGRYCVDGGGINIAEELVNTTGIVSAEWIAKENPDVILCVAYSGGYQSTDIMDLKAPYDEWMNNPVLKEISAVKNNRVYVISFRHTNGPTYPSALASVAKWFYPERFPDLDPAAIHQEYIDTFLKAAFDVRSQGVYTYTE